MFRDELESVRKRYRRRQPPGGVIILGIATISVGLLLLCAQAARLVYSTGLTGQVGPRLQADYRPWTPQAFAPVSTSIIAGTPDPIRQGTPLLEPTAGDPCSDPSSSCAPEATGTAPPEGSPTPLASSSRTLPAVAGDNAPDDEDGSQGYEADY